MRFKWYRNLSNWLAAKRVAQLKRYLNWALANDRHDYANDLCAIIREIESRP